MRIAFEMGNLHASQEEVETAAGKHLQLIQMTKINRTKLIEELAQWYGILVPIGDSVWQFVHRTVHDYLAARYWVESGLFASGKPSTWNTRTAYAICLLPDGTDLLVRMLNEADQIEAFSECLYNRAPFDAGRVAAAVVSRVDQRRQAQLADTASGLAAKLDEDFYGEAGPEFLRALVQVASASEDRTGAVVACYALAELNRRQIRTPARSLAGLLGQLYRRNPFASIEAFGRAAFPLADVVSS